MQLGNSGEQDGSGLEEQKGSAKEIPYKSKLRTKPSLKIEPIHKDYENSVGTDLMKEGMYDDLIQNLSNPMLLSPAMDTAGEFVSLLINSEAEQLKELLTS
eukprot:TRINITY_DN2367_c0_g4_i6.p2 TRINITY_DN2367_c0_g4~~TRINITY_DN2367_c0_g4_i6.p2  ORF type:complete len:101 (-),score=30.73 TRINITY_DN2367_c0_g4_i6:915-1217(-)